MLTTTCSDSKFEALAINSRIYGSSTKFLEEVPSQKSQSAWQLEERTDIHVGAPSRLPRLNTTLLHPRKRTNQSIKFGVSVKALFPQANCKSKQGNCKSKHQFERLPVVVTH